MRCPTPLWIICALMILGCMDPTPDYEECVKIETARCDARDQCRGEESFDEAYPHFDVDTCVAYAKEHCRTRKISGDYTPQQVDDCVAAIIEDVTCDDLIPRGVDETKDLWDCHFIDDRDAGPRPPDPEEDGGPSDAGEE